MFNNLSEKEKTILSLKEGANIHKEVRKFIKPHLKPGIKLVDIARLIEYKTRQLSEELSSRNSNYKSTNYGIGFPSCLSLNNVAAHYHPINNSNNRYIEGDVLKIDFGTEVNGWIIDSAFTITDNPIYFNLLNAVKEGVYKGIETAGVDVRINEWGKNLQKIVESYETEFNGKKFPIKVITNLSGHSIGNNGVVHGDIRLSPFETDTDLGRMKKGVYAIEILAVTSIEPKYKNNMPINTTENGMVTLYSLNNKYKFNPMNNSSNTINLFYKRFGYLPFTTRYLTEYGLQQLLAVDTKYVNYHYPLIMPPTCIVAHFEHTLYIDDTQKIVFSKGDDY
jgi:methionyl aminopeptidase